MKKIFYILTSLLCLYSAAQTSSTREQQELYKNYREDQFYLSVTYNILNFKSVGIEQTGFSPGLHFGFIRDMPINDRRNRAIGIGLGLSVNAYNQNVALTEMNNRISFGITDDFQSQVSANRFSTYLVELPIEYRWRTSTATQYNFWRIYAGIKLGYMFFNSSILKSNQGDVRISNLDVFNRFQYGLSLNAGYNTWNVHVTYNISSLFNEENQLNGETIDLSVIKLGLIFYIL